MERLAVISAILETPEEHQEQFNHIVAEHKSMVKGRLGLPLEEHGISAIAIVVIGGMDEINSLTGKLGSIPGVQVKTSISQNEI